MSASARFIVYSVTTGEILRAGVCPVGQESIQAQNSTEAYLGESQVAAAVATLGGEHLSDALHYVDIDASNVVKKRVQLTPFYEKPYAVPGTLDPITFSSLPSPSTSPSVAATAYTIVGMGTTTTGSTTTGSASFTFASAGQWTITFNAYPRYFPFTEGLIVTPSVFMPNTRAFGRVGTLTPSITATVVGVSATGVLGDANRGYYADVTGVAATGAVGSSSPGVDVTLPSVSATAVAISGDDLGVLDTRREGLITGVSATGAVGTVEVEKVAAIAGTTATGETAATLDVEIIPD